MSREEEEAVDAELCNRVDQLLCASCLPIRELHWWLGRFGEDQGLAKLVQSLGVALEKHVQEHATDIYRVVRGVEVRDVLSAKSREFLELLCLWFEHIICAKQLVNILQDGASWPESTAICRQKIKSATEAEPQRVCSRSFRAGDIVWNCKQCQMDTTCVLCQQCFRDSDHEGHDVYFQHLHTDAGGCCDCGDPGAWDPKGFCSRHGAGSEANPIRNLPPEIAQSARIVIEEVVQMISKLATCGRPELVIEPVYERFDDDDFAARFPLEEERLCNQIINANSLRSRESHDQMAIRILLRSWMSKIKACAQDSIEKSEPLSAVLKQRIDPFVLVTLTVQNADSIFRVERERTESTYFRLVVRNATALTVSFFTEHLSNWLLKTLCVDSDAFTRITCHALTEGSPSTDEEVSDRQRIGCTLVPMKQLIVQDLKLPETCSKSLRNLYIRLLVDGLFKQRFAIAFAKTYNECATARINRIPVLEMSDGDTIFGLSVQFLNRANHVLLLVHDHDFLHGILQGLLETIRFCDVSRNPNIDGPELDLLSPVLTHRKTKSLVTDLQYVLNTPGMARYFLTQDPSYLTAWFDTLAMVYGMHEQSRIVKPFVPKRDERWVPAFNLSLSLLSLFSDLTRYLMYGEVIDVDPTELEFTTSPGSSRTVSLNLVGQGKPHLEWCDELLTASYDHVCRVLRTRAAASTIVSVESRLGRFPFIPFDVSRLPVTFHCLLQRFFAMLHTLCIASTLDEQQYSTLVKRGSVEFWLRLIRQPLNALIFFAQSNAGLWNRNEDVAVQAMNYQSLPFTSGMFLDMRVLQTAALNLPGDVLINFILCSFDLVEWIGLSSPPLNGFNELERYRSLVSATSEEEDNKHANGKSHQQLEKLTTSMLELIAVISTELPPPTPFALRQSCSDTLEAEQLLLSASDAILRREIIHFLAIKRCTISEVNDKCTHLKQIGVQVSGANIKRILNSVAKEITRTDGMGPIQFELKQESWTEFDPLYHRLARTEKEQARERWLQNRMARPIEKQAFPGDLKPKSASTRYMPQPATTWYQTIHPAFVAARENILLCHVTFKLLRQLIVKIRKEDVSTLPAKIRELQVQQVLQQGGGPNQARAEEAARAKMETGRAKPSQPDAGKGREHSTFLVHLLGNTLHLITLQIYLLQSKYGIQFERAEASSSSDQIMEAEGSLQTEQQVPQPPPQQHAPGSVAHYVQNFLRSKDPLYKQSVLDSLLSLWYNEPRIDETNRENVRWILAQVQHMDPTVMKRIKKFSREKKSGLQAERERESRKRKAQRSVIKSIKESQKQFHEQFGKEMLAGLNEGEEELSEARHGETDMKKTRVGGGEQSSDDDGFDFLGEDFQGRPSSLSIGNLHGRDSTLGHARRSTLTGFIPQGQRHTQDRFSNLGMLDNEEDRMTAMDDRDLGDAAAAVGREEEREATVGSAFKRVLEQALVERNYWRAPACVSCRERHRLDDGPTYYIGFRQKNDVIVRAKSETSKLGFCVYWPESEGRNNVVQLCGHAIHSKCLERYRSSIENLPGNSLDSRKNEFFCPLCKKLSNFEVPCVPPGLVYLPKAMSADNYGFSTPVDTAFGSGFGSMAEDDDDMKRGNVLDTTVMWFARHATPSSLSSNTMSPSSSNTSWFGTQIGGSIGGRSPEHVARSIATSGSSVHGEGYDLETSVRNSQIQEFMEFSSRHLEPLSEALHIMVNKKDRKGDIPFRQTFNFHSEQGRLREMQTMVLHNDRETPHHQFNEDPIAFIFSVALTFIAEREAACFGKVKSPALSVKTMDRMRRMFEAVRAFLLVGGASGMNHLLSEMYEMFSEKRSEGFHCVLRQSPEMLLILSVMRDCSQENVVESIRSTYILKLAQTLLELSADDIEEAAAFTVEATPNSFSTGTTPTFSTGQSDQHEMFETGVNPFSLDGRNTVGVSNSRLQHHHSDSFGGFGDILDRERSYEESEEQVGVFQGALEMRDFLLDRFQNNSTLRPHPETLTKALVDSISGFIHVAQMMTVLASQSPSPNELKLVPREKIAAFMESKLHLPSPMVVMQHEKMRNMLADWIDQVLSCTPHWVPRSQLGGGGGGSQWGSTSSSSSPLNSWSRLPARSGLDLTMLGGRGGIQAWQETAGRKVPESAPSPKQKMPPLFKIKPLAVRPLVRLKASYTELYDDVHHGVSTRMVGSEDPAGSGKETTHDRAICLICGELLVAGKVQGGRTSDKGECTRHTEEYHNGIGLVLLFRRSSSVLLINGAHSAYWGSLYVDENGDDQHKMPSLPMYLDTQRYQRVMALWASNGIPAQIASVRNSSNVVIRTNYY